jgi:hypothetical protein
MELLILKSGDDYLRVVEGEYRRCGLDKASVFPLARLEDLREHRRNIEKLGFPTPEIRRLRIEETSFEPGPGSPEG